MTSDDEQEIWALMRSAVGKTRGYAAHFEWASDRDLEEWQVASILCTSLEGKSEGFFSELTSRGRGNDPPDCEAVGIDGKRIALEVTELVEQKAIRAVKRGNVGAYADWSAARFISCMTERLISKGQRYPTLKGGPYEGGYVVLIYTDEPVLNFHAVQEFMLGHLFVRPDGVARAFLLLSYDPHLQTYPYFELAMK